MEEEREPAGQADGHLEGGQGGAERQHGVILPHAVTRAVRYRRAVHAPRAPRRALLPGALLLAGLAWSVQAGEPPAVAVRPDVAPHAQGVAPVLVAHCLDCHAGAGPAAGLDLTSLSDEAAGRPLALLDAAPVWARIQAAVEAGVMPPPEGRPLEDAARAAFVASVEAALREAEERAPITVAPVRPRRLSRSEWVASVQDVFGVGLEADRWLPPDELGHGFDHVVDAQTIAPARWAAYLQAAEEVARRAIVTASPERPVSFVLEADDLRRARGHGGRQAGLHVLATTGDLEGLVDIPRTGRYEVEVTAFGQQAGPEVARLRVAVVGSPEPGRTFDVPETSEAPGLHVAALSFEAGVRTVRVSFLNDYWRPEDPDPQQRDRNLAVGTVTVRGPLAEGLGALPEAVIEGLADPASLEEGRLEDLVARTAALAWRRPVGPEEVTSLAALVRDVRTTGDEAGALRALVVAVLASPHFLLCVEGRDDLPDAPDLVPVSDHELAVRLAYALGGRPPDAALRARADDGTLGEALHDEARRLLDRGGRQVLVERFLLPWLEVPALAEHVVDPTQFPGLAAGLTEAWTEETRRFLLTFLDEDRDVRELADAPFTWLDPRLARHYGLREAYEAAAPTADGWRRVDLGGSGRGGLLGQGSVLALTSEATRTSPVRRGRWILDVLLGRPPPPPPPGIPPLEAVPETDGDTVLPLRERLARHRADAACITCHVRMDPLGFALEGFDAVGRRRRPEDGALDTTGVLPDGRRVEGLGGLQALLREEPDLPRRFADRLLTYMLGRGLTPRDAPLVRWVVDRAARDGHRVSAYVQAVVDAPAFRWRTARGGRAMVVEGGR
jgi:hypothetical protein